MTSIVQALGIDRLSRDERLILVQEIWDTIAAEPGPSALSDAQRAELARRVADDDTNPEDVVAWEHVKAQVLERLRSS